ncbi:N-acetyltransferase [Segetibacter sp. 3557_3]|uniref:GNAT family N-acetyltransferase n=1 Tax=Segetibacter sp. 3557_3 TaxID=2547429 RepID=UPI001058B02E|nr:GNAT family N-acetyltransferase [Segetibacter sp. 3557_3]TDH26815.1 N-acetyltransferase [Segetibacter sp. 3557_3]
MVIIESERLCLRQFTAADADFIIVLLNSPGWLKYIGDRNISTRQDALAYLDKGPLTSYKKNELGLCLVQLKSTGEPLGMCGLLQRDYLDGPDIGFAFLPQSQGYGYAYEIATKVLAYGFTTLRHNKLFAITLPANRRSINLIEKLGMHFESRHAGKVPGEELSIYARSAQG